MSRSDRLIGIALGLLIGVAAVILFVFLDGSSSIDAPSLDQPAGGQPTGIERQSTGGGGREDTAP
jgi:hypothetical protein